VHRRIAALLLVLALLTAACSSSDGDGAGESASPDDSAPTEAGDGSDDGDATSMAFPGDTWATTTPEAAGMDAAPLDELASRIADNSQCLTVVKDGEVVYDQAWTGDTETDDEAWSATKSMTSTLVGIAQAEGLLDVDDPVAEYVPEWAGTESEDVTVRNLLSNDSGRYYDFITDYTSMALQAPDKTAFAIGLEQQHPVGTHWEYNNSAIQVLEQVLEVATGGDVAEYAQDRLFEPLGMTSEIRHDDAGNTLAFMGAQVSCHDLARFGHLYLNEGEWDGEQVVPAEYVQEATSPSQDVNPDYGFLWWLYPEGSVVPDPGVANPPAAFAALGLGGQLVVVVPEDGLVITRMGPARENGAGQGSLVGDLLTLSHQALLDGGGAEGGGSDAGPPDSATDAAVLG
jgi:CubicO group peptidase (beta-lactamase class C family)